MDEHTRGSRRNDIDIDTLLRTVDHDPPALTVAQIAAIVRARRRASWLRRVALVVLALGVGVGAWAMPGSPLPGLVQRLTGSDDPPVAPPQPSAPDRSVGAGLAVVPGDSIVVVTDFAPVRIRVTIVDDSLLELRTTESAATFESAPNRLRAHALRADAILEVRVPRSAPLVAVDAAGERALTVRTGSVTAAPGIVVERDR